MSQSNSQTYHVLCQSIQEWGTELGFNHISITDTDPGEHREYLAQWLDKGYQGEMEWMRTHQPQRNEPGLLVPNALRVISVRMNYLPENTEQVKTLKNADKAYISRYALGRDYHKLIRKRLANLAKKIKAFVEDSPELSQDVNQRPFVDSAPVLEKAFAEKAGLGWIGKNTLVIHQEAGSWFFLGELITNIPLPINNAVAKNQCGECSACLSICPTDAFVAPYKLDAKRCISYLTIELKNAIPEEFREPIGNRVFGCDDCQLICPWNKFAKTTQEKDFSPRHSLNDCELIDLFLWTEEEFLKNTEGSPIRRIGYERWLRNLAVGLGNANKSQAVIAALEKQRTLASPMVQEHIDWAIARQGSNRRRARKIKRPTSGA